MTKKFLSFFIVLAVVFIWVFAPMPVEEASRLAVNQAQLSNEAARAAAGIPVDIRLLALGLGIIGLVALWWDDCFGGAVHWNRQNWWMTLIPGLILFAACSPTRDVIVIEPNEAAFIVPISGDPSQQGQITGQMDNAEQVFTSEVQISRSWVGTGGFLNTNGFWRPSARVYIVNTTPVNVQWTSRDGDQSVLAIPVESAGSQGFSIPITISAELTETPEVNAEGVTTCASAAAYLREFGRKVDVGAEQAEVETRPLVDVLNTEVRNEVARFLADRFATVQIQEAVASKARILQETREHVIPLFGSRGICIRSLGTTDGLLYDNVEYQQQIDNAANRSLDEAAAYANATTTAVYANSSANATQIAIRAVATQQAVERESLVLQAGAQATAQMIQANAEAEAQRLLGEQLEANPMLVDYAYAQNWSGGCTQNCFGQSSGPVPIYEVNPAP